MALRSLYCFNVYTVSLKYSYAYHFKSDKLYFRLNPGRRLQFSVQCQLAPVCRGTVYYWSRDLLNEYAHGAQFFHCPAAAVEVAQHNFGPSRPVKSLARVCS